MELIKNVIKKNIRELHSNLCQGDPDTYWLGATVILGTLVLWLI